MFVRPASAELVIEVTQGVDGALPIAVVPFDTSQLGVELPVDIARIVASDLNRSGVLRSMERAQHPESPHYSRDVNYGRWRQAGQDYLVVGRVLQKGIRCLRYSVSAAGCAQAETANWFQYAGQTTHDQITRASNQ